MFFSRSYLQKKICSFLEHGPASIKAVDPDALLKDIEARQGLLMERFQGYFSFSHLTLQEYLTARYIADHSLAESIILEHIGDRRWREVVLLAFEMIEDDGLPILEKIQSRAIAQITAYPSLARLLQAIKSFSLAVFGSAVTLAQKTSVVTAVSVIAASRASGFDIDTNVGIHIAMSLARASDSALEITTGWFAIAPAGINCARAIATARAIASNDDLRVANINQVIQDASELLDKATDGHDMGNYNKSLVVTKAVSFAYEQMAQFHGNTRGPLAAQLASLTEDLARLIEIIPRHDAFSTDWLGWAGQLEQAWLITLGLTLETATLTIEEAEAWATYTYLAEITARCLDTALYLNSQQLQDFRTNLIFRP